MTDQQSFYVKGHIRVEPGKHCYIINEFVPDGTGHRKQVPYLKIDGSKRKHRILKKKRVF